MDRINTKNIKKYRLRFDAADAYDTLDVADCCVTAVFGDREGCGDRVGSRDRDWDLLRVMAWINCFFLLLE